MLFLSTLVLAFTWYICLVRPYRSSAPPARSLSALNIVTNHDLLSIRPSQTMASNAASEIPDYSDNGSRLNVFTGVAITFLVLSYIVVALRVYVRAFLIKSFKYDDWTILASLVSSMNILLTCLFF